jgi:predicted unusual protein kinase regulating ubiquinone biosynthesis (AarF/ABC1/UbiB family)
MKEQSVSLLNYGSVAVVYKIFNPNMNIHIALKIFNPRYYEYILQDKPYLTNGLFGKDINQYIENYIENQLNPKRETTIQDTFYIFACSRPKTVRVPKVYYALCDDNVIAMEYVPGKTFAMLEHENKLHHILTKEIVLDLVSFLILSIQKLKIIHMDMHMGNIMYNSEENAVYCIDFGWISVIPDHGDILRIIYGFATNNMNMFSDSLSRVIKYNPTESMTHVSESILCVMKESSMENGMIKLAQLIRNKGWSIKLSYVPILLARINAIAVFKSLCKTVDEKTLLHELSQQMIKTNFPFFTSKNI